MKIRKISEIFYLLIFIIASIDYFFGSNDQSNRKNILLIFVRLITLSLNLIQILQDTSKDGNIMLKF